MQIITLTTDFGTDDWFAGTMKGVILSVNPKASIVDITHGIRLGDIRAGAFALAAAYRFFPRGTVHVAVVDPGVGSERKAIAVRTKDYFFVGPDNGLLSCALAREVIRSIHRLENKKFFLPFVSQTFQGRDVFAPVAAHLSKGVAIGKLGPRAASCKMLTLPTPIRRGHELVGEVIYLDRFGNGITNIRGEDLEAWEADGLKKNRALARNPPPTPPRRGALSNGCLASSPPGRGVGVGSWAGLGEVSNSAFSN
ncbi:MAG: SAM-dependent chlorinase/fluorinase, partial [Verrucomicrobia bacterium]|nr:SAM-dependent chlorinase/fluorinase [Verrucomicrobiota bacterium]